MSPPNKWKPHFAEIASVAAKFGATDREIAEALKVSERTLHYWKREHPELAGALKLGKEAADDRVEKSLYHKAIGYTFESEKVFQFQGEIVRAATQEHVPPDTTACIFWLKNRRAQEWRDVHKHEVGKPGEFDNMSADELRAFVAREAEAVGLGDTAPTPARGNGASGGKPH